MVNLMNQSKKAYMRKKDWLYIGVRTLGLPTGLYIGSIWRNEDTDSPYISIIAQHTKDNVRIITVPVIWTEKRNKLPRGFRKALKVYLQNWPESAREHRRILMT